jgi:hypothetical protein
MRLLALILVVWLCSCASTRHEMDMRLFDDIDVLNAKIDNQQKTLYKVYEHIRLMELRQYEQIKTDSTLNFYGLVIKP